MLERNKFYPLGDRVPGIGMEKQHKVAARWTGMKRPPKAGEWYLSGADITAYRASNDLSIAYHIAELCEIERVTSTVITKIIPLEGAGD